MTSNEFVMWLRGFADLADPKKLSKEEWQKVRSKLDSVEVDKPFSSLYGSTSSPSLYSAPTGRGILSCSLPTRIIGFK